MEPTTRDAILAAVILLVLVGLRRRRTGEHELSAEEMMDIKRMQNAERWNGQ